MVKISLVITIVVLSVTQFLASWTDEVVTHETTQVDFVLTPSEIVVAPFHGACPVESVLFHRGKFTMSPPSERAIRGSQPKSIYLSRDEAIIHYDGENADSLGLVFGGTIEGAIRLTPTELWPYNGWNLDSVRFYHCSSKLHSHRYDKDIWRRNIIFSWHLDYLRALFSLLRGLVDNRPLITCYDRCKP